MTGSSASQDDAIRRGARQLRLQLLSEQFASKASCYSTTCGGSEENVTDYKELLHITPQETLEKLKELDELHAMTEQRGLQRLKKLQSLEGRISQSGSMASSSCSSSAESLRFKPASATSISSSIEQDGIVTLDLRPKGKQNLNLQDPKPNNVRVSSNGSGSSHKSVVTFDLSSTIEVDEKQLATQRKSPQSSPKGPRGETQGILNNSRRSKMIKEKASQNKRTPRTKNFDGLSHKKEEREDIDVQSHKKMEDLHLHRRSELTRSTSSLGNLKKTDDDLITEEFISVPISADLLHQPETNTLVDEEEYPALHAKKDSWKQSEAYIHAMQAGIIWQTMVGEHVRFPKEWFNGERFPTMTNEDIVLSKWKYIGLSRVRNTSLNKLIRRKAGGRILLHIVIRDAVSFRDKEDIVIGSYHPQGRGLVSEEEYRCMKDSSLSTDVREVWLAYRTRHVRSKKTLISGATAPEISTLQPLLTRNRALKDVARRSPLLTNERLTNQNIRAVFGGEGPLETTVALETEIVKLLESDNYPGSKPVSVVLMQKYLFK